MLNNFRTLKNLENENQTKNGLRYQFLNYHQKRIVEGKMFEEDRINNEKKVVDINKFYNFEISFGEMENLILESTVDHLNFWKKLKTKNKEKDQIIKEGHKLFKKVEKVKRNERKNKRSVNFPSKTTRIESFPEEGELSLVKKIKNRSNKKIMAIKLCKK